jgi:hypothetical protein
VSLGAYNLQWLAEGAAPYSTATFRPQQAPFTMAITMAITRITSMRFAPNAYSFGGQADISRLQTIHPVACAKLPKLVRPPHNQHSLLPSGVYRLDVLAHRVGRTAG